MPMQLTVNRNRKASANFNSEGHGISITVELDQSLLGRPEELHNRIGELYHEAETALDQQANGNGAKPTAPDQHGRADRGNGNGRSGTSATDSQRRAITAISRRLGLDAVAEARDEFGLDLDRLTVREASGLIDHLKALDQPARQNGGAR